MHYLQIQWIEQMKKQHSECFKDIRVLDVGALDINGNNRQFFKDCDYIGLDVIPGDNVDVVSICHEYEPDELFDTIISTSALEHDMYREKTLMHMYELLKPAGWLFIVACHSWKTHGTQGNSPHTSGTSQIEKWRKHYKKLSDNEFKKLFETWRGYYENVEEKHFDKVFGPDYGEFFEYSEISMSHRNKDIRFVGEKKNIGIDIKQEPKDIRFIGHKKIGNNDGARQQFNKAQRKLEEKRLKKHGKRRLKGIKALRKK